MSKILLKRHKREVSRAKAKVRLSEPDVRTPEQVRAAREASRPSGGRRNEPVPPYVTRSGPAESAPGERDIL